MAFNIDDNNKNNLNDVTLEINENGNCFNKRKILHFSDGTIELDDDGNDIDGTNINNTKNEKLSLVLKSFRILNFINYKPVDNIVNFGSNVGKKTLKVIDYVGESFANILGITNSKYSSEANSTNNRSN